MKVPMEQLRAAAAARHDAMVADVRQLAQIETPSLEPACQLPAFELLAEWLAAVGMRSRRRSGRRSGGMLLARPERPAPSPWQLLMGHCDTVWPVGTLARMPLRQVDGRLHGPGVYDMKAGLVQGIHALGVLADVGARPAVAPLFLINSDEEVGSGDSFATIVRVARIVDRVFVLEPSLTPAGLLKTSRKGVVQYRIRVHGRAAHAGLDPERGISAILEMSLLVQQLFALNDPAGGVSVNVGIIEGGTRPNVIAPESSAIVDVRVPTHADAARVDAAIRGLRASHPEARVEVEATDGRGPMEPGPAARKLWHVAHRLAAEMDVALQEGCAGGGSDGNITNLHAPTLDGLGAVGDGAHAIHEHVEVERMIERTALLAGLLLQPPVAELRG